MSSLGTNKRILSCWTVLEFIVYNTNLENLYKVRGPGLN